MTMVPCEFRVICGSTKDSDRRVARYSLPVVPTRGDAINVLGNPYVVHNISWAAADVEMKDDDDGLPAKGNLWCYVRLAKLFAWAEPERPKWSDEELARDPKKLARARAVEEIGKGLQDEFDGWVDGKHTTERVAMLVVAVLPDEIRAAVAKRFSGGEALPPPGYTKDAWAAVEAHIAATYGKK